MNMSIYRVSLQRSRCRTDNHISANGQTEPLTWPYTIAITIPIAISHSHSHHIHCRYHTNNSPFFVVSCDKSATSHTWHLTTVFMATLPPPCLPPPLLPPTLFAPACTCRTPCKEERSHPTIYSLPLWSHQKWERAGAATEGKVEEQKTPYTVPQRQPKDHTLPARLLFPNEQRRPITTTPSEKADPTSPNDALHRISTERLWWPWVPTIQGSHSHHPRSLP